MSSLAPLLQSFFVERLDRQRRASPETVSAYRDCFRLLLFFVAEALRKAPSKLLLEDLDAEMIGAFLDHLEQERHNSVRTRNARLAAVHSLFNYAALRHPEHAQLIQRVLAIPQKRCEQKLVSFLSRDEVEALLQAPDCTSWTGRRDRVLLAVAVESGLRVSELTGLRVSDVAVGSSSTYLHCRGKGRKERSTPLTSATAALLRAWMEEGASGNDQALFPTRGGGPLSRSAVEHLVTKYARLAANSCPSLAAKRVTPHVLRHTAAMALLQAGVDSSVIALWLGHAGVETTQIYLHADMTIKERALAKMTPAGTPLGRYQPPDELLAFLDSL